MLMRVRRLNLSEFFPISAKIQISNDLMIQTNSEWIQTDSEEDSDRFRCLNLSEYVPISAKIQTCSNLMIQTNSEWIQTDSEEDSDKIQTRFREIQMSESVPISAKIQTLIQTWIQTDSEDDSDGFRHDFSIRVMYLTYMSGGFKVYICMSNANLPTSQLLLFWHRETKFHEYFLLI